jgi:hypothetical protein
MANLPNSYVQTGRIDEYFEAMLNADAPERFSTRFLENLGFKSTNDRAFIGVLKDLGFIDQDGKPKQRYYDFLDRSQWKKIVADGLREAFAPLFAINRRANEMDLEAVKNKLRTLYAGQKNDNLIKLIAKTFVEVAGLGDFTEPEMETNTATNGSFERNNSEELPDTAQIARPTSSKAHFSSLQYHINIVLPETRDQAVYDAIFRSLREHLG